MNQLLSIFFLFSLLISCIDKREVEGYWRLDPSQEVEDHFSPYELRFHQDTLCLVDGYNFKQSFLFVETGKSITIASKHRIKKSYSFEILSDNRILFADRQYLRTKKHYFTKSPSYDLLGWITDQTFHPKINSNTIHLIKDGNTTKVTLNDVTTNLKNLPKFLRWGHGQLPTIYLYIGKGIELKDLLNAYCWIKYSGYSKVELVTSNISFEQFYSLQDYTDIDDSLFTEFLTKNSLPPLPSQPKSDEKIYDIVVCSKKDFHVKPKSDTLTSRYNFPMQLDLKTYLTLTEKINKSEHKTLKRFIQ